MCTSFWRLEVCTSDFGSCRDGGSPVHAGIGPAEEMEGKQFEGLPRSRGDRPWRDLDLPQRYMAPPFTRGSACAAIRAWHPCWGSPVHAGIGLGRTRRSADLLGLLRSRGDRPSSGMRDGSTSAAPPFTRGSAPNATPLLPAQDGSPVHAGIGPSAAPHAVWLAQVAVLGRRLWPALGKNWMSIYRSRVC